MTAAPITPAAALEMGWSIIPTGRDKRPIIGTWKPFQSRRPTQEELSAWQARNPATWAMVTGAISGRITLDFDGAAGRQTLELLGLEPHRKTPSGGYHVDFKHPGWRVLTLNSKTKRELGARWPGLDIRADGGYVLFTGRIPRGEYVWLRDPEPYNPDILPTDLRRFLGLWRRPVTANTRVDGKVPTANGRVNAELLIRRALDRGPSEGRNTAGLWLAVQARDNGYSQSETHGMMRSYMARVGNTNTKGELEPYTEAEALATAREAFRKAARDPWESKGPNTRSTARPARVLEQEQRGEASDLLYFPFTDSGNAERLVALYGRDIRFCSEMKKWLVWDGRRWSSENNRRVKVLAKKTMRKMYEQAASIEQADKRETAERHARKSESAAAINAMLSCAEYEEGIPILASELDTHPLSLNFWNGTLDLQAVLRPHRREDLITKLVHFEYRPKAQCPRFIRFVYRIMGDGQGASDKERGRADRLVSYLQKCFGYALTANVSEKAVFCFFDAAAQRSGNNGKTTLLETTRFLLSEYSAQVLIDNLMMHHTRESNASLADQADLRGARFVTTSEAEEGQKLAVGKLKYITAGMGKIKSCRKYENPIDFDATHKLFIDANHRPVIRATEKAVWNRLKPIPFTVTIPREEIDTSLPEKLKAEAEGILSWMVEGCRRWLSEGLGDPPEVAEASAAWQAESDRFPVFLEEKCILSPDAWLPVAQLWPAYQSWCEANNEGFRMQKATFDGRMKELGCRQGKRKDGATRAWIGIRFRTADDDCKASGRDNGTRTDAKC